MGIRRGSGLTTSVGTRQITRRHKLAAAAATVVVAAAGLIFELSPAQAGVVIGVTPTFPSPVAAGTNNLAASLTITNNSTAPEDVGNLNIGTITLVPSCGQVVGAADCPAGFEDPGVLQLNPGGIMGAAGTACVGTTFVRNVLDTQGKVQFVPNNPVVLPGAGSTCQINFTFNVLKSPTKDAQPGVAGVQTAQLGFASGTHATTAAVGGGTGTSVVTVTQVQPTISTQATTPAPIGQPISDTATLAGGNAPTGTIIFRAFGPNDVTCANPPAFTSLPITVMGNGAYNSGNFTPGTSGTYRWTATYSGDVPNVGVASPCNDLNETSVVNAASPAITTQATATGAVNGPISDTATLTLGVAPTGTITFRAFGPGDPTCANPAAFTTAIPVFGNGNYNSGNFFPTAAGTYLWTATYSGDANNGPVTSPCNALNESSVVTQATPTITTQASAAVVVGGTITDTATLAGGINPAGSITFTLFGPDNATCTGAPVFTSVKTVAGNGPYTSDPFTVTAPGTYRWIANYGGSPGNPPAGSPCNAPNESVQVAKKVPTLVTQASPAVQLGGAISDTATLSDGFNPTGSIVFNAFGPGDGDCVGPPAFTATKPVTGNGNYTSGDFTPTRGGLYIWVASYSGDANNAAVVSPCTDANEFVRVRRFQPVITTQASANVPLGGSISDTATITGGNNPTGFIVFAVFGPDADNCRGRPAFSVAKPINGNGTYTSDAFTPTLNGLYRWVVIYGGDDKNEVFVSGCNEPSEAVLVGTANPPPTTPTVPPPPTTPPPTVAPPAAPVTTTPTTAPPAATTVTTIAQNPGVRALVVTGSYAARLLRIALIMLVVGSFAVSVVRRPKNQRTGHS